MIHCTRGVQYIRRVGLFLWHLSDPIINPYLSNDPILKFLDTFDTSYHLHKNNRFHPLTEIWANLANKSDSLKCRLGDAFINFSAMRSSKWLKFGKQMEHQCSLTLYSFEVDNPHQMYTSLLSCKFNGFRHVFHFQVVFLCAHAQCLLDFLHALVWVISGLTKTVFNWCTKEVQISWLERARFILCNSQCDQSIESIKRLTRGNSTNLLNSPRN